MGSGRYQANNFITSPTMLTVSSAVTGILGSVVPYPVSGSATMQTTGYYTGDDDHQYTIQIDSIAGGAEVGQATFSWRRDDSAGWEASGVVTNSSYTTLEYGIQAKWTTGAGADFVVGDTWSLLAMRIRGRASLIDRNPSTDWRTTTVASENVVIDLGSSKNVTSMILGMHNLTSSASITLQANSTTSWASPAYSQVVDWASRNTGIYLDETYRYWRVVVADAGNTDQYIRVGELYLGTYMEPAMNFTFPDGYSITPVTYGAELSFGPTPSGRYVASRGRTFSLSYGLLTTADRDSILSVWEQSHDDQITRSGIPIWFTPDGDLPEQTYFGLLGNSPSIGVVTPDNAYWSLGLSFTELPRA